MNRILEYVSDSSYDDFCVDNKTKDAVIRNFEIIGEASKNIPKEAYDHIPWADMYGLRNKVSHEYFGVNDDTLWEIIKNHLPKNLADSEELLSDLQKD